MKPTQSKNAPAGNLPNVTKRPEVARLALSGKKLLLPWESASRLWIGWCNADYSDRVAHYVAHYFRSPKSNDSSAKHPARTRREKNATPGFTKTFACALLSEAIPQCHPDRNVVTQCCNPTPGFVMFRDNMRLHPIGIHP